MAAYEEDIEIEQGATFRKGYDLKDGTRPTDPALNLTGFTGKMHIRATRDSSTVAMALTTENGGIQIEPTIGRVWINVTDEQTARFTLKRGVYDLLLTDPYGDTLRLVQGEVTLSEGVTR